MILLQARTNSTRLPNKVMEKIGGEPLIKHCTTNCANAGVPFILCIPKGDPLKDWCIENFIKYYEGSENNVLERFYRCARTYNLKWIIRLTADSPFVEAPLITYMAIIGEKMNIDFMSNAIYPCTDGKEVEFISFKLLEQTFKNAVTDEDKEHVTTWIKKNINNVGTVSAFKEPVIGPKLSVDTPEDLENVRKIYQEMLERKPLWS